MKKFLFVSVFDFSNLTEKSTNNCELFFVEKVTLVFNVVLIYLYQINKNTIFFLFFNYIINIYVLLVLIVDCANH